MYLLNFGSSAQNITNSKFKQVCNKTILLSRCNDVLTYITHDYHVTINEGIISCLHNYSYENCTHII